MPERDAGSEGTDSRGINQLAADVSAGIEAILNGAQERAKARLALAELVDLVVSLSGETLSLKEKVGTLQQELDEAVRLRGVATEWAAELAGGKRAAEAALAAIPHETERELADRIIELEGAVGVEREGFHRQLQRADAAEAALATTRQALAHHGYGPPYCHCDHCRALAEAGGDDPDYSPAYQDEYQRLWHEAVARAEAAERRLEGVEAALALQTEVSRQHEAAAARLEAALAEEREGFHRQLQSAAEAALESNTAEWVRINVEEWERIAAEKGIPFLLDHLGLDGLGNEVNGMKAALAEARDDLTFVGESLRDERDRLATTRQALEQIANGWLHNIPGVNEDGSVSSQTMAQTLACRALADAGGDT